MSKKFLIYLAGLVILGLVHGMLRATFSGPTSLFIAICYLVFLRFLAERFGGR